MGPITFEYNVAFTLPVNPSGSTRPALTQQELWQGIKRGGRNPNDFADYVARCDVLEGGRRKFVRRLTLADGAVHTAKGEHLDQDVWIAEGLHVSCFSLVESSSTFMWGRGPARMYCMMT